jgi:membrane protein YqaA with SNARE-associated domain
MAEGYAALFLSAFLAATILPFSSELLLLGMAASGDWATLSLFLFATGGNVLGSVVNWGLGRFFLHWQDRRWFPVKAAQLAKAEGWFNRFGVWTLLLAWVPIVGDPLTVIAGVLRVRFGLFLLLVTIGKAGRYAVLLQLIEIL